MLQMSKLLMDSDFRKGAQELLEEFKKTGVEDVQSKVCGRGYLLLPHYYPNLNFGTRICWRYSLISLEKTAMRRVNEQIFSSISMYSFTSDPDGQLCS